MITFNRLWLSFALAGRQYFVYRICVWLSVEQSVVFTENQHIRIISVFFFRVDCTIKLIGHFVIYLQSKQSDRARVLVNIYTKNRTFESNWDTQVKRFFSTRFLCAFSFCAPTKTDYYRVCHHVDNAVLYPFIFFLKIKAATAITFYYVIRTIGLASHPEVMCWKCSVCVFITLLTSSIRTENFETTIKLTHVPSSSVSRAKSNRWSTMIEPNAFSTLVKPCLADGNCVPSWTMLFEIFICPYHRSYSKCECAVFTYSIWCRICRICRICHRLFADIVFKWTDYQFALRTFISHMKV